ncbi:hypothetical protein GCM10010251_17510 [Streptomyces aurantiogriseus]|uniref:Uncharacterized protein n=1 Tax=Streptomyces aurantiogriseus TaxID=66870 RepID=A0A918C1B9_9ACTN|nr:hypothetical protein GCM10010251_17510 [Streptomyces aurantiogriseus]
MSGDGALVVCGMLLGDSWPKDSGFTGKSGCPMVQVEAFGPLRPLSADRAAVPPTGYPEDRRRLDADGTAQPPPLRGVARAALLTRIAWARTYVRRAGDASRSR